MHDVLSEAQVNELPVIKGHRAHGEFEPFAILVGERVNRCYECLVSGDRVVGVIVGILRVPDFLHRLRKVVGRLGAGVSVLHPALRDDRARPQVRESVGDRTLGRVSRWFELPRLRAQRGCAGGRRTYVTRHWNLTRGRFRLGRGAVFRAQL